MIQLHERASGPYRRTLTNRVPFKGSHRGLTGDSTSPNMNIDSKRLRGTTVVSQVIEEIRQLIASGRYGVNDKLPSESQLAEAFGVGLSSIREAIKVFNHLGILESRPAKGTFISDRTQISKEALTWSVLLGRDDIREMIDFRKAIELECMLTLRSRVQSGNDSAAAVVDEIKEHLDSMTGALESGDNDTYIEIDFDFHQSIVQGRDSDLIASIFDTLRAFIRAEMEKTRQFGRDYIVIHREHQEMVRSIQHGSVEDVVRVVEAHFQGMHHSIDSYLKASRG